jgi:hypothetical protein
MEQKPSRHRTSPPDPILGELDAIVVGIFETFEASGGTEKPEASRIPRGEVTRNLSVPQRGNVIHEQSWRQNSKSTRPNVKPNQSEGLPHGPAVESADGGAEAGPVADVPDADDLLNEEEEHFVEQTVGWLARRPHPDILLARIWNRLIDLAADEEAELMDPKVDIEVPLPSESEDESDE